MNRFRHIIVNWRTSIFGLGMILGAIGDIMQQLGHWDWDAQRLFNDWVALCGGIGLLFAKDVF